jgi:hypothetical protein
MVGQNSRRTFTFRMGEVVLKFVDDPVILEKITGAWSRIKEEHPLTRGATQVEEVESVIGENTATTRNRQRITPERVRTIPRDLQPASTSDS